MSTTSLTAVVLTLNEETHLPDCLDSLRELTRNVLVVDSGSSDRTVEIARARGACVVHSAFEGYASQRNKALDLCQGSEWVLFLDADERLTPASSAEIERRTASAGADIAGFWLPRRNIAFGRELNGGGWWPDYQARIIRQGHGRYDQSREVHEVVEFEGATERLVEPLVHLNYESRREFMLKQRAYTLRQGRDGKLTPPRPHSWVTRPAREFMRRFIALRGYRDGLDGAFMAAIMALEELRGCALSHGGERS